MEGYEVRIVKRISKVVDAEDRNEAIEKALEVLNNGDREVFTASDVKKVI